MHHVFVMQKTLVEKRLIAQVEGAEEQWENRSALSAIYTDVNVHHRTFCAALYGLTHSTAGLS